MLRWRWLDARPRDVVLDVALALLLSAGALSDASRLPATPESRWAALPALVCTLAVATRRLAPVGSSIAALLAATCYEVTTHDPRFTYEPYAVLLVLYMLGRTETPRQALRHRLTLAASAAAFVVIILGSHQTVVVAVPAICAFAVVPYAAGLLLARRARNIELLESRIDVLRGEREVQARSAAHQERMRVARELHDVAAHCLTEMVIHSGAARVVAGRDPAAADQALETAARSGRAAGIELQRLAAGISDDSASSRFHGLVTSLQGTPIAVMVTWPESARPLTDWADLVAHRLLQEALTNAARHSPGARVRVDVSLEAGSLSLSVTNEAAPGWHRASSGGFGLLGMRERVEALGGEIHTGPLAGGGYAVQARLPLAPPPLPAASDPRRGSRRLHRERWWEVGVPVAWLVVLVTEALTSPHRSGPVWFGVLVVTAMALAAVVRRRSPIAYLVVVSALATLLAGGLASRDYATVTGLYTVILPTYAVGSWSSPRRASVALASWAIGATIVGITQDAKGSGQVGPLMAAAVSAGIGAVVRAQRQLDERLAITERAVLEQTRTLQRLAVDRERRRLAEAHHATVARQVEDLVSATEAARRLLVDDDERFARAVVEVERGGRDALTTMRDVLGSLRADDLPGPGPSETHLEARALDRATA